MKFFWSPVRKLADLSAVFLSKPFKDSFTGTMVSTEVSVKEEGGNPKTWFSANNLSLNSKKTKEIVADCRRSRRLDRTSVGREGPVHPVSGCLHPWGPNLDKTHFSHRQTEQQLQFLRKLRRVVAPPDLLKSRCSGRHRSEWKSLQRVFMAAQWAVGSYLPISTEDSRLFSPKLKNSFFPTAHMHFKIYFN